MSIEVVSIPRRTSDRVGLLEDYVELTWSAHVGPSALLLVRRLARLVEPSGQVAVDLGEVAAAMGVGEGRLEVALRRLVVAGLVVRSGDGIAVSGLAPLLSRHQLERSPTMTVAAHHRLAPRS
jgi:hypothetical protein